VSSSPVDHYKTLGLAPTASQDEIKRRYRELARRYHPDVNRAPEAAHKIKVINEAYHILGDADRRVVYDAERALRSERQATSRSEQEARARQSVRPEAQSPPRAEWSAPKRPASPGAGAKDARSAEVARLLTEAHLAYVNRRYRMAEDYCQQALVINQKSAAAFEMIGDIRRAQGQRERAATAYAFAIQLDPGNIAVQIKHDKVLRVPGEPGRGPQMARHTPPGGLQQFMLNQRAETRVGVLNVISTVSFTALAIAVWTQNSLPVLFSNAIDAGLAIFLLGMFGGLLLAFNGNMRPIAEELFSREEMPNGRRRSGILGPVLTLLAMVFFYFSLCAFIGSALNRNRLSGSLVRVYLFDFAVTLFMAFVARAYTDAWSPVLMVLFGGNIAFPATLLGWSIGDAVRLRR
jgi:curved DNA-binding protein CbpA